MPIQDEPITQTKDLNSGSYRLRKLETNQAVMQEKMNNFESALDKNTAAVENLTKTLAEARGGWKTLVAQGSFIVGVIAVAEFGISLLKSA